MIHQNDKFSDQIKLVMLGTKCDSNEPSVIQICNLDNVNRWCIALFLTIKNVNADWGFFYINHVKLSFTFAFHDVINQTLNRN